MEELIVTKAMRKKINDYLGYELIKKVEVGHHIYDEAPGLGKIGIEGNELSHVVTNKQLDSNGNVEWYKNPHPMTRPGAVKPFHCKLTTVSSKKAKILIASLFPEEAMDKRFLNENEGAIKELRRNLQLLKHGSGPPVGELPKAEGYRPSYLIMGPNDMFLQGAMRYYLDKGRELEMPIMLYGPNDMFI